MWDLPGPGLEPVSPALAGGFLTTVPPGKSQQVGFVNSLGHIAEKPCRNRTCQAWLMGRLDEEEMESISKRPQL